MAHELTHVVQQTAPRPLVDESVQRTIGDGHDLASPRFSGNVTLEAVFDGEQILRLGSSSEPVRRIQESLLDMGYPLPLSRALPGRADGTFGPETQAAVRRFQTDARAAKVDGIVGPETMGLLDTHDSSVPAHRPPQTTGPLSPPLGGGGCDDRFRGVGFTLASQVASGVNNPATIVRALVGGRNFLRMRGHTPIRYTPAVTIASPSDAVARQFRVGFVQTLLSSSRVATYGGGAHVATVVPTPIKDGDPNDYHPIFVTPPAAGIVEDFTTRAGTVALRWPDVPGDGKFIDLADNPSCAGAGLPAQTMTSMRMRDTFRLWVAVQHTPSGCVRSLHHVDWDLDWSATVSAGPTVTVVSNVNNVTEPNGDGRPRFVQGGPVPGAVATTTCA